MYQATTIANYFLLKSFDEGIEMTPMKLIKLVYIAHGWNLAINEEELINEQIEAWQYGPVIPSLYHAFKSFRNKDINALHIPSPDYKIDLADLNKQKESELLDRIWEVYKEKTGTELSSLTHKENTPWEKTWREPNTRGMHSSIIPNKIIKEYYTAKATKNANT